MTLDYYRSLLNQSLSGDVYGSLLYGLVATAVICIAVSIIAATSGR